MAEPWERAPIRAMTAPKTETHDYAKPDYWPCQKETRWSVRAYPLRHEYYPIVSETIHQSDEPGAACMPARFQIRVRHVEPVDTAAVELSLLFSTTRQIPP